MDFLFKLDRNNKRGLQNQLRDKISAAIIEGRIAPGTPMPSSRSLSERLGIARNTVMAAYESLQDDEFIISRERSGYYVNDIVLEDKAEQKFSADTKNSLESEAVDWSS